MNVLLGFFVIGSLIIIHATPCYTYHETFTWQDVNTMMSADLKGRMKRGAMQMRRKYCGDCAKDVEDYRICGNNGIMYPNECIFECSKLQMPALEEAEDYGTCGTITFEDFKMQKFQSHY